MPNRAYGAREGKGMGPRIRDDNEGGRDGFSPPSLLGQAPRGNDGSWGGMTGGGGRGWVPAYREDNG